MGFTGIPTESRPQEVPSIPLDEEDGRYTPGLFRRMNFGHYPRWVEVEEGTELAQLAGVAVAELLLKFCFPLPLCGAGFEFFDWVRAKNGMLMTETVRVRMSSEPTKHERSLQTAKVSTATQPPLR